MSNKLNKIGLKELNPQLEDTTHKETRLKYHSTFFDSKSINF